MKEERFSIHTRAWGAGSIVWIVGFTSILAITVSPWTCFFLLSLIPTVWAIWNNEKLPGGVEK